MTLTRTVIFTRSPPAPSPHTATSTTPLLLNKKQRAAVIGNAGLWPRERGTAPIYCLAYAVKEFSTGCTARKSLIAVIDTDGRTEHRDLRDPGFAAIGDMLDIKKAVLEQQELTELYARDPQAAAAAKAAAGPHGAPHAVIKAIVTRRKQRGYGLQAPVRYPAADFEDSIKAAQTTRETRSAAIRYPLRRVACRGWDPDMRASFLRAAALENALRVAAKRRQQSSAYNRDQLFASAEPSLGGRTRFEVFCELCARLELVDVVRVCLNGNTHSERVVLEFLRDHLLLRVHDGYRARQPSKARKESLRRAEARAAGDAGNADALPEDRARTTEGGRKSPPPRKRQRKNNEADSREPFVPRDLVLFSRAVQHACAVHVAEHPSFGGGAVPGETYDLCLPHPVSPQRLRAVTVMVTAVHPYNLRIDLAEMAPLTPEQRGVAHADCTHSFTGVIRQIDFCAFAAAKERAAQGAAAETDADDEAEAARDVAPIVLRQGLQATGAGLCGDPGDKFLVDDAWVSKFGQPAVLKLVCHYVNVLEKYGKKFGTGRGAGARDPNGFEAQCVAADFATVAQRRRLRRREARKNGAIFGFTGASCGVNIVLKPGYMRRKHSESHFTNYPIPYAFGERGGDGVDPRSEVLALLKDATYVGMLENLQRLAAARYGSDLIQFILEVVPAEFRLGEGLIWNQAAMTGGSYEGHCRKHTDQFNWVNGLYHVTAGAARVEGGHTVFFARDRPNEQVGATKFENGRAIVGTFSKVPHGSTAYTGGRAILGAYVDRRIVKFCLAFEWKNGEWVPGGAQRYQRLKSRFEALEERYRL
jgi:hypothetical protein